jgi:hypothetical protein
VKWLKHAFAIDSPEQFEPNQTQRELVEKLCKEIVRRRLTTPALLLLEMHRPLNYLSAQFLRFLQPIATVIADANGYEQLIKFLEQRGSIDYVCRRLEALEAEGTAREQASSKKPGTQRAGPQPPERHDQD